MDTDERLRILEEKVGVLDKGTAISQSLFERNLDIQEKTQQAIEALSCSFQDMRLALTSMQDKIGENIKRTDTLVQKIDSVNEINREIETMKIKVGSLSDKIDRFQSQMEKLEDKSKVDLLLLAKENIVTIIAILYIVLRVAGVLK